MTVTQPGGRGGGFVQVEGRFYEPGGLAEELRAQAGCSVPVGLANDRSRANGLTILMSKLPGATRSRGGLGRAEVLAVAQFLARMHAHTWGPRADRWVAEGGLQPQGTYWHLDTRPDELAAMSTVGLNGRLRLAARGLDRRLKADRYQAVVHGDAKAGNILLDNQVSSASRSSLQGARASLLRTPHRSSHRAARGTLICAMNCVPCRPAQWGWSTLRMSARRSR